MLANYAKTNAGAYTVVSSSCHHNLQRGNFKIFFVVVSFCFVLSGLGFFCLFVCLFFWRGLHGIVLNCMPHVQRNFLSSLDQSSF